MVVLTKYHYRALASLYGNFSAVFLGSVLIPTFGKNIDLEKQILILFGGFLVTASGVLSLFFAQKGKL